MGKQSRLRAARLAVREPERAAAHQALFVAGQTDERTLGHLRALSEERRQVVLDYSLKQLTLRKSPHRARALVTLGAMATLIRHQAKEESSAGAQLGDIQRDMRPPCETGELDRLPKATG
jgi:hypothetical protein